MNRQLKLTFRKGDLLAIGLVLALALGTLLLSWSLWAGEEAGMVQVYQDGVLIAELSLEQDTRFTVTGDYANTVEIRDGQVAVTHSDCPGADCVHSGWIHSAGRSIICLPNRVEIRVVGQAEVDFVVG